MKQKYWYRHYIGECPLCGRDKSYRQREYTPKPKKPEDRIQYLSDFMTYDHCDLYEN